jgi:dTDP-glucose 4,6-dehydratase
MNLLITGGTGFFGRALLRHLHIQANASAHGHPPDYERVIVLSRDPVAFARLYPALATADWLQWVVGDVTRADSLASVARIATIDAVLHAATDSTSARGLTALEQFDQITVGTRNILDLAVRLKARRFLLTSSGGVYGLQPPNVEQIPESYHGMPDPLLVNSSYGLGKRVAEHLCCIYGNSYGLETVIARCFAFVGQDLPLKAHFAVGNFIRDGLLSDAITVNGDGSPMRSYLDQTDLAQWLLVMLERGRAGQAYNVGSDQAITIAELAHLVRDLLAPGKAVQVQQRAVDGLRNRYVPSITKAREELGLRVTVPLDDAIRVAAAAHRKAS